MCLVSRLEIPALGNKLLLPLKCRFADSSYEGFTKAIYKDKLPTAESPNERKWSFWTKHKKVRKLVQISAVKACR